MSIGERIKKLRNHLELTQEEFGTRIQSARNTIAGYEIGRREPSNQAIRLICTTYGVNEEWLRTGSGEMMTADASDELEALAKRYDLSVQAQIVVEKFVNLKKSQQDTMIGYLMEVAAAIEGTDAGASESEKENSLHADLDRELENQKKAADGSTGLGSSSVS